VVFGAVFGEAFFVAALTALLAGPFLTDLAALAPGEAAEPALEDALAMSTDWASDGATDASNSRLARDL
jgi:hypothetical protein